MALFSQREGIRPVAKTMQRESIDNDLRNRLWSGLKIGLWDHWSPPGYGGIKSNDAMWVELVVQRMWLHYFKLPVDRMPAFYGNTPGSAYEIVRAHFFEGEWWKPYDLIEFLLKGIPEQWREKLKKILNNFLEDENSAYRIVNDEVVEITDEHEIEAIESALDKGRKTTRSHLSRGLDLLSDRKQPDYRNSIKESVSAIEATCQVVAGMPKATLSDCIKVIKTHGTIHPAFEQALLKLYGYTSDEGGIRHALTEESVAPSFADAKFMLVASSAFVNFIWIKASELGINIKD